MPWDISAPNQQKTGKTLHLEALRKRVAPHLKKSEIVLFDDSDYNVKEVSDDICWLTLVTVLIQKQHADTLQALAKGYCAVLVEPAQEIRSPEPAPSAATDAASAVTTSPEALATGGSPVTDSNDSTAPAPAATATTSSPAPPAARGGLCREAWMRFLEQQRTQPDKGGCMLM